MSGKIQMLDLRAQYLSIKEEIDTAMASVVDSCKFINGPQVEQFAKALEEYSGAGHVIPCANGTDALQIALMGLGLEKGDEVIVPAFTYVATAEVIALLGLVPVMADVDPGSFCLRLEDIIPAVTPRTKAIVPVHLFGQCADMEPILEWAAPRGIAVVEDNAQSLGARYSFSDGRIAHAGTMGTIGCISFFPTKPLGCYGDGGALMCNDDELAQRLKMIASHGQRIKYHHEIVGCNSRLDTLQAAVGLAKLPHLDSWNKARAAVAERYRQQLSDIDGIILPARSAKSTHVYHQYTIRVRDGRRDALKEHLAAAGIASMIYYPLPLQEQKAFAPIARAAGSLGNSARLCAEVLSLPICPELSSEAQDRICEQIRSFFK